MKVSCVLVITCVSVLVFARERPKNRSFDGYNMVINNDAIGGAAISSNGKAAPGRATPGKVQIGNKLYTGRQIRNRQVNQNYRRKHRINKKTPKVQTFQTPFGRVKIINHGTPGRVKIGNRRIDARRSSNLVNVDRYGNIYGQSVRGADVILD